jgi:hypothetical protein
MLTLINKSLKLLVLSLRYNSEMTKKSCNFKQK